MRCIKMLGSFGGKSKKNCMTCLQISESILIDAGEILNSLEDKASLIEHIFLTHSHLDHIIDIPFLIDSTFSTRKKSLKIYASKGTIKNLRQYVLNDYIWPDFSKIKLPNGQNSIEFIEINPQEIIKIDDYYFKAIKTNHTQNSYGYVVTREDRSILFTGDTYKCDNIWEEVNSNSNIKSIIIDVSFPNDFKELAYNSKHLTPDLLKEELKKLKRDDVKVYINHIKPIFLEEVKNELKNIDLNGGIVLKDKMEVQI